MPGLGDQQRRMGERTGKKDQRQMNDETGDAQEDDQLTEHGLVGLGKEQVIQGIDPQPEANEHPALDLTGLVLGVCHRLRRYVKARLPYSALGRRISFQNSRERLRLLSSLAVLHPSMFSGNLLAPSVVV